MEKGGDGFRWFTEEEIQCMLNRIQAFREERKQETKMGDEGKQIALRKVHSTSDCKLPGWNW